MWVMDCLKGMADLTNNAILLTVLINRIYEVYQLEAFLSYNKRR